MMILRRSALIVAFIRPTLLQKLIQQLYAHNYSIHVFVDKYVGNDSLKLQLNEHCRQIALSNSFVHHRHISQEKLGCYNSNFSAITWFLNNTGCGLILEDDIFPSDELLELLPELLLKYEKYSQIASISSMNLVPDKFLTYHNSRFRLSVFSSSWGWATWADKWNSFAHDATRFNPGQDLDSWQESVLAVMPLQFWQSQLERLISLELDSWAFRWELTNLAMRRFSIVPNRNLSMNLGFAPSATNTFHPNIPFWLPRDIGSIQNLEEIEAKLDLSADIWMGKHVYGSTYMDKAKNLAKKLLVYRTKT